MANNKTKRWVWTGGSRIAASPFVGPLSIHSAHWVVFGNCGTGDCLKWVGSERRWWLKYLVICAALKRNGQSYLQILVNRRSVCRGICYACMGWIFVLPSYFQKLSIRLQILFFSPINWQYLHPSRAEVKKRQRVAASRASLCLGQKIFCGGYCTSLNFTGRCSW